LIRVGSFADWAAPTDVFLLQPGHSAVVDPHR
jgi:hypothetical protein